MEGTKLNSFFVFFFTFVSIVPSLMANIGEFDEVWEKRAEVARQNALESYVAVPENVTSYLNQQVRRTLEEELGVNSKNSSRRQLGKKYLGPCRVTNPIDRCWRCQPNWAANRKRLADCGLGFGYNATGGKYGKYYFVTDSSDENMINPKPGTLRHAVIQNGPLWILFARDMNIRLSEELIMQGDKTIDARGVNVHIAYGAGITIQFVKNVIIHGLHIHDIYSGNGGLIRDSVDHYGLRTRSDGDGISIFGASNIWIDHVSMWKCTDGIIDVVEGSTAITISNSHFTDHNEVMLFGASDAHSQDQIMQITVAFNHFGKRLIQRMPRCRWGYIHVVNNDYTHWEMYAIGGSQHPTIVSQGNRFIAPDDITKKEVTKRDYADEETWKHWTWSSESDVLMNGAFFVESGNPHGSKLIANQYDKMTAAPGGYAATMTRFAGALSCRIGRPC